MDPICLFCRGPGPFTTVEHIVPESLGNDSDVLVGLVCDMCQNYISREIEKPALEKTPIAFWRTFLGISTKKGKFPSVNVTPPSKGKVPAQHPITDLVGFTAHYDGSTSVDIDSSEIINQITARGKTNFKLVLSPWHLIILGRFIGKIGLEYLALHNRQSAFNNTLDRIRDYVRRGSQNLVWPVYYGSQGQISDLFSPPEERDGQLLQTVDCYKFSLGQTITNEYLFVFGIGTDLWMICLSHNVPDARFTSLIQGVTLNCLYYDGASFVD